MADPYHFDADPSPGSETIRIRIQAKKDLVPGKAKIFDYTRSNLLFCAFIVLLRYYFSVNTYLIINILGYF